MDSFDSSLASAVEQLESIAHNVADSLGSGIGMLVGMWPPAMNFASLQSTQKRYEVLLLLPAKFAGQD
jgi:hypothetical protein